MKMSKDMPGKRQQLSKAAGSERIRSCPRHTSLLKSNSKEFILPVSETSTLRVALWPTARDQLMVSKINSLQENVRGEHSGLAGMAWPVCGRTSCWGGPRSFPQPTDLAGSNSTGQTSVLG